MGTLHDWTHVFINGGLWGLGMLIMRVLEGNASSRKPGFTNILLLILAAFLFGFLVIFGWRAFKWPLIGIFVPVIAAFILTGRLYRNQSAPAKASCKVE